MMIVSLFAAAHYLALGMGLGSVFMRGRYLRSLRQKTDGVDLGRLFIADNFWGLAAILWIVTGLMRAFGGIEKGTTYYIHNSMFWVKMALFALVFILEVLPMYTYVQWRIARKKGKIMPLWTNNQLRHLILHNDVEVFLITLIPFIASMMARGIGY